MLLVGRIGRAHGVRGDVLVDVRTDDPAARFAPGTSLATDPPERGPLTVRSGRMQSGRLVVSFEGVADRTAAEALRGTLLLVDPADLPPVDDPDEFHDVELIGLVAADPWERRLGVVSDVVHGPGGDLLVVRTDAGAVEGPERVEPAEVLVPFVRAVVPTVDVPGGRVIIDPPAGLFEL